MAVSKRKRAPLWKRPELWLALAAAGFVVVLFSRDLEQTSPGPLSAVHASLDELDGAGSCKRCHGGFGESLAGACLTCHEAIESDLDLRRGLHGTLDPASAQACGTCHSEHHGAEFRLVSDTAFAAAGVADVMAFDHALVGLDLAGKHTEIACSECHAASEVLVLAHGTRRFGGLDASCASCHEDVHGGELGNSCADCHVQTQSFGPPPSFAHASFDDGGDHAGLECATCHEPGSDWSIERSFDREGPGRAERCDACHDQPHTDVLLAAAAFFFSAEPATSCRGCHDPRDGGFSLGELTQERLAPAPPGPVAARVTPELHARAGFELDGAHTELGCADCHGAAADVAHDFSQRFPGREREDCAACHTDPHGGEFEDRGPLACATCHATSEFAPSSFGLAEHRGTDFPLHGAHTDLACAACHEPSAPQQALRFDAVGTSCADCHDDAHGGEFDRGPFASASCSECHSDTAFRPAHFGLDQHGLTGFALDGAHGAVGCAACHTERLDSGPLRFAGLQDDCAACHTDVHDGLLAQAAVALASPSNAQAAPTDCAECHGATTFSEVDRAAFDHGRTGFALVGAHAQAQCETCHRPAKTADADLRRFGRASDLFGASMTRCDDCHADAHGGALLPVGGAVADCSACHGSEAFAPATIDFDHGRWTGIGLEGGHAGLECAGCHERPAVSAHGPRNLGLVRGSRCYDCHADPHVAQFGDVRGDSCLRCHDGDARLTFDHAEDARFALDANHRDLACASCHDAWPLEGGGSAVRYKPIAHSCADCHGTVGDR
ncbi:cytochrome c3 family protein [Engelhardtia mirabilis]|uniref:Class III cytochrome C family protein n=1 Tax=Engelhardtia mirabilis TaxID=2528011 RepID=A0A518BEN5_9BACT|nr:Class III cytochrome C family protein [Planctomycetes bacterium Pla133]QDU99773.1 Class III cytochrome C family protein [Planctomycetes bacterium Pla86]